MKNIRIYDSFLDNVLKSFKLRYLMISLSRTYIYTFDGDNTIYFRKRFNNPRKISLMGGEKIFKTDKKIDLRKMDYSKYGMIDISKLITEYVVIENDFASFIDNDFDIAKKYNQKPIVVDSITRREPRGEIVSMYFDEKEPSKISLKNMFWINNMTKYSDFNSQINS